VDGEAIATPYLPLVDDGEAHTVEIAYARTLDTATTSEDEPT
jgi:hypothetical protein